METEEETAAAGTVPNISQRLADGSMMFKPPLDRRTFQVRAVDEAALAMIKAAQEGSVAQAPDLSVLVQQIKEQESYRRQKPRGPRKKGKGKEGNGGEGADDGKSEAESEGGRSGMESEGGKSEGEGVEGETGELTWGGLAMLFQ